MHKQVNKSQKQIRSASLWQFTASYIALMLMLPVMGISVVFAVRAINEQNAAKTSTIILQHAVSSMDNSMETVSSFSNILMSDPPIVSLMGSAKTTEQLTVDMAQVIQSMPALNDSSMLIQNYWIYSALNDVIFAPKQGFLNIERYYASSFSYGGMSCADWKELLREGCTRTMLLPVQQNVYQSKFRNSILMLTPYINTSTGRLLGCIAYYFSGDAVEQLFSEAYEVGADFFYIQDSKGQTLFARGNVPNDLRGMQVSKLTSRRMGFSYALGIPKSKFIQQSWSDTMNIILLAGALTLVSLGMAIALLIHNRRPLESMANTLALSDISPHRSGLWTLERAVSALSTSREDLVDELCQQAFQQKNAFFARMVAGSLRDEREAEQFLQTNGIDIKGSELRGVLLCIHTHSPTISAELEPIRIQAELRRFSSLIYLYEKDPDTHFLLWSCEAGADTLKDAPFQELYTRLKEQCQIGVRFCVGIPCSAFCALHYSFSYAERLVNMDFDGRYLLLHEQVMHYTNEYTYPRAAEQQLLQALANGRETDANERISEIYRQNFGSNVLTPFSQQMLFSTMLQTLEPFESAAELSDAMQGCFALTPEQFFARYHTHCTELCSAQRQKTQQQQEQLAADMLEYIKQNIANPDMGLSDLSAQFGMTEKYISIYLKEKGGVHFSEFLESLRIARANELLRETDISIAEVAAQVGYVNVNSFRRCYQRVQGVSPSTYRMQARPGT